MRQSGRRSRPRRQLRRTPTIDPKLLKGAELPPFKGEADITIKDGVKLVRFGSGSLRGQSGTIQTLAVSSGDTAGLSLSGPFSVAADGLVDADLTVTIRDPEGAVGYLAEGLSCDGRSDQDELRRPRRAWATIRRCR